MKGKLLSPISIVIYLAFLVAIILSNSSCTKTAAGQDPYLLSTTSPTQTSAGPVKIGVLLPLTGQDAKLGETFNNAMELAVDMENGTIGGRSVKLVVEDEYDQDETMALEKVKKLVQSDKVNLIFGPYHDDSSLSVTNYTTFVPMINIKWSPLGYSMVAIRNKYNFWTSQLDQSSTYPLGLYAYDSGIRTVTTLSTTDATSNDLMQGFVDGFRSKSGKVILQQKAPPTQADYSPYLDYVKSALANVKSGGALVCSISGDQGKLALFKAISDTGLVGKVPVFIAEVDGLSPSIIHEIGDNIIGTSVIEKYLPELDNSENRRFLTAYRQKYQSDPDTPVVEAYNAMRVVIEALKITKGNSYPDILGPILQATEVDLPTGHFRFSQNRTGIQPLRVGEVVKTDKFQIQIDKEYPPEEYYWASYP